MVQAAQQGDDVDDDTPVTAEPVGQQCGPAAQPGTNGEYAAALALDRNAEQMADLWGEVADLSAQLAANLTGIWWDALLVTRPGGLDMAGAATMLAARLARLGPDGDPVEQVTLGSIAYMQGAHDHARVEAEEINVLRRTLHREMSERFGPRNTPDSGPR